VSEFDDVSLDIISERDAIFPSQLQCIETLSLCLEVLHFLMLITDFQGDVFDIQISFGACAYQILDAIDPSFAAVARIDIIFRKEACQMIACFGEMLIFLITIFKIYIVRISHQYIVFIIIIHIFLRIFLGYLIGYDGIVHHVDHGLACAASGLDKHSLDVCRDILLVAVLRYGISFTVGTACCKQNFFRRSVRVGARDLLFQVSQQFL
jgi:hypothetical protein